MRKRFICSMLICMVSLNTAALAFEAKKVDGLQNFDAMDERISIEDASENVGFDGNSDVIDSGVDKVYTEDGMTTIENHVVLAASSMSDAEAQIEELIKKEESNYTAECEDQEESSSGVTITSKKRPFITTLTTGIATKIHLSYYYTKKSNGYPQKVSSRSLTFSDAWGVKLSKEDIETHTYKKAFVTTFHIKTQYYILAEDSHTIFKTTSTYYKVAHSLAKKTATWKKYKNGTWKTIATKSY